jgi:hypothetical protein
MWRRWWGRKPDPSPGEEAGGAFVPSAAASSPGPRERTPEDEELLDRIAAATVRWGMEVPAIFLLESSKPLSFVGSQFLHFLSPIVHTVFEARELDRLALLLERRDTVEELIVRIEAADPPSRRRSPTRGPKGAVTRDPGQPGDRDPTD